MKIKITEFKNLIQDIVKERKLSKGEKSGLKKLEKSIPKKSFMKKYGKDEGEKVYYATLTKQAKKKY